MYVDYTKDSWWHLTTSNNILHPLKCLDPNCFHQYSSSYRWHEIPYASLQILAPSAWLHIAVDPLILPMKIPTVWPTNSKTAHAEGTSQREVIVGLTEQKRQNFSICGHVGVESCGTCVVTCMTSLQTSTYTWLNTCNKRSLRGQLVIFRARYSR